MKEGLFDNVNFSLAEAVVKLGTREKKAVTTVLSGLCESQITGKEQKPIRVSITPDNLFNLRNFAQVMHEMAIDIFSSAQTGGNEINGIFIFQPRPNKNSDFFKGILASKETTDHFIASFLDYEPAKTISKPHSK